MSDRRTLEKLRDRLESRRRELSAIWLENMTEENRAPLVEVRKEIDKVTDQIVLAVWRKFGLRK